MEYGWNADPDDQKGTEKDLSNLVCQLVSFEELQVLKDDPKIARQVTDSFRDFTIASILILLVFFGLLILRHPSRVSYIAERAFTFKVSAYEFINTNFVNSASFMTLTVLSFLLSFFCIYFDQLLDLGYIESTISFSSFLILWFSLSIAFICSFFLKWFLVSAISKLFQFRGIHNFQLFDFINFLMFVNAFVFAFTLLDFTLNNQSNSWLGAGFIGLFMAVLILYIFWFSLKFLNNSPRKKLLIISKQKLTEH